MRTIGSGVIIDSAKEVPDTSSLHQLLNIDREDSSQTGLKEYGRSRWLNVLEREYTLLATG